MLKADWTRALLSRSSRSLNGSGKPGWLEGSRPGRESGEEKSEIYLILVWYYSIVYIDILGMRESGEEKFEMCHHHLC